MPFVVPPMREYLNPPKVMAPRSPTEIAMAMVNANK
jgi:hypothetical protein